MAERNARRDQAVFNGSGARLVAQETGNKAGHFADSGGCRSDNAKPALAAPST